MPNTENQIYTIQQNINVNASNETAYFTTLDLKHNKVNSIHTRKHLTIANFIC